MPKGTCSVDGCELPVATREWCSKHYARVLRYGDPTGRPPPRKRNRCTVDGCDGFVEGHGYCTKHYSRWKRHGHTDPTRTRTECSMDDCTDYVVSGGLCSKHHHRWKKHGDPTVVEEYWPTPTPLGDRFWPKVNEHGPIPEYRPDLGPCWIWTGRLDKAGYGTIKTRKVAEFTHRLAYMMLVGPIPEGLDLDHLCLVRACCNPAHLDPVTRAENNRRMHEAQKWVKMKALG